MSLADDAKILLIPSGYKTATPNGKLYSVFPTDGNQDFRIDRATTGTRINPGGLIETMLADTPRLDHFGGNCPSVLREVGRTNLVLFSEQFSGSNWGSVNTTITANQTISPDAELTGDKLQRTSTSASYRAHNISKSATATTYTTSAFIKKGSDDYFAMRAQGSYPSRVDIRFRFDTEQIYSATAVSNFTLLDYGVQNYSNGWYRLNFTYTSDTHTNLSITFSPRATDGNIDSSDTSSTSFAYVWGAQVEQGIGATSYIKTTTASVTRNLDNINCENETYETGNDVTWFLDFDSYTFTNSFRPLIVIRNSGFTETMDWISYNSGSDYYFRIRVTNQSSLQTIIAFGQNAIQMFQRNKVAVRLYGSNYEIYVNGVREYTGTSTNGDWKIINNSAILNDFGSHSEAPSMKLYDFRVYDKTMTQSDLETLTTL